MLLFGLASAGLLRLHGKLHRLGPARVDALR
jgi:hypothetical protein